MRTNRYTLAAIIFSVIAGAINTMFWIRALDRYQNRGGWMYLFAFGVGVAAVAGVAGLIGVFCAGRKVIALAALLLAIAVLAAFFFAPLAGNIPFR